MIKIWVELGKNSYSICIGSELLAQVGGWMKERGLSGKAVIITDSNVGPLYADVLRQGLVGAGFDYALIEVPAGEAQKTLESAGRLYQNLAENFTERTSIVLALGGGVIGDLAGFVASTYMRGVPLVQVPTSLLAMVDSAVGGKTAVDHHNLKNMIGTFYQPRMVIADVSVLKTLPEAELSNAMGEVIKYGVIRSRGFFEFLLKNMAKAMAHDVGVLETIVRENTRIKVLVVEVDEHETGPRAILNFGHTIGHALEAVTDFQVRHGEAVAIGMMSAARLSRRLGFLQARDIELLDRLILLAGLPVNLPPLNYARQEKLLESIKHDKKVRDGKIRFVLLRNLGEAFVTDKVDVELIREVLFADKST
ncbi:MAG: 3-dehydroquinate synthase [Dehalococcoidales bacterium]|nr:3-dehydroquinate synthase [Dehalococcoidales bacterium]